MDKSDIYTIIVTYNGMKWIKKCVDSVLNSSIKTNIIVVDNGLTDSTIDFLQKEYNQIQVIKTEKNLGFGRANNIGIKKALTCHCEYILLLNQDAYLDKNAIDISLKAIENEDNVGFISLLQLNGAGTYVDSGFLSCIGQDVTPDYFSDLVIGKRIKKTYDSSLGYAAAWIIPIETLRLVGGFNPLFCHYGEDTDYCHRVIYHGLRILFVPEAKVYHDRIGGQGNSKVYNNHYFFRKCLINALDVNVDWHFISKYNYRLLLESACLLFLLCNKYFTDWVLFCWYYLWNHKKIKFNRCMNKSLQAYKWLN